MIFGQVPCILWVLNLSHESGNNKHPRQSFKHSSTFLFFLWPVLPCCILLSCTYANFHAFFICKFHHFIPMHKMCQCLQNEAWTPPRTSTIIHDLALGRLLTSSHLSTPSCHVPRTESCPKQPECSLRKRKLESGFFPLCLQYFRKLVNSLSASLWCMRIFLRALCELENPRLSFPRTWSHPFEV